MTMAQMIDERNIDLCSEEKVLIALNTISQIR